MNTETKINNIKNQMAVIMRRTERSVFDMADLIDLALDINVYVNDAENEQLVKKWFTFTELEKAHVMEVAKGYGSYSKTWVSFDKSDVISLFHAYYENDGKDTVRLDLGLNLDAQYYHNTLTGTFMVTLNSAVNDLSINTDENLLETIKVMVNLLHKQVIKY